MCTLRHLTSVVLILLSTCLIFAQQAYAQEKKIYVSRDANGNLIFSDSPSANAEEYLPMSQHNIMQATPVRLPQKQPEPPVKHTINIIQPEQEATIRDNTGSVHISGSIKPSFEPGFRVRLLLNGQVQGEPQSSTVFVLRDVDRGEHTIQLELIDQSGKLIATSSVTTFFLHRARLISPN